MRTGPPRGGRAWGVFSGKEGTPQGGTPALYELPDPDPSSGGQFGWSMTRDRNRVRPDEVGADTDPVANPLYLPSRSE